MSTMSMMSTLMQAPSSDQLLTGTAPTGGGATGGAGQTGTVQPGGGGGAPLGPGGQNPGSSFMLILFLGVGFLFLMTFMTSRREKKKRTELMNSLKKGDEVLTIGGVIGTIAELREGEVVLRVDVNSNSKIRVVRSAIQQNLSSGSGSAGGTPQVEVKAKSDARDAEKVPA